MITAVRWRRAVTVGVCALLLAGCSGGGGANLPAIPEISAAHFPKTARSIAERRIVAVAASPDDPWTNGDLAMILHAHDQLGAAETLYQRAEALSRGQFRWTYLLGVTQQESGRYFEASESFRRALEKRSYVSAAIRLGEALAADRRPEEAAPVLRMALEVDGNEAAASYALGQALMDLGETAEAIAFLERAVALSPRSGSARYALGSALRSLGDEDAAQRVLASVGEAGDSKPALDDPIFARVTELAADEHHFLNLGKSLEAAGKLADAITAYERALSLNPGMASAHANLVGAFGRIGDIPKAEAHYKAASSIDPNIEELHNNWGVLQATRQDPSAAAAAFRRAIEVNPQSAKAHANLGVALIELGNAGEAARHFREAVSSDPTNRPARMNLGTMALESDRPAEAAEHLQAALLGAEDGSEPFIRYTLGHAYIRIGRESEAEQSMREALRLAEAHALEELAVRIQSDIESLFP